MTPISRRTLLGRSLQLAAATAAGPMLAAATARAATPSATPAAADPLWSNIQLVDQRGEGVSLATLETPLTFVNVWAHWCSACLAEINSLQALATSLTERRMTMLLLSHPANWANDVEFAQRRRLPFRLVTLAPGTPAWARAAAFDERNGAYAVPRSLIYRRTDRAMVLSHVGSDEWNSPTRLRTIMGLAQA